MSTVESYALIGRHTGMQPIFHRSPLGFAAGEIPLESCPPFI